MLFRSRHKEIILNGISKIVSTPKYGMLFRPNSDGSDNLYIGQFNEKGLPSTLIGKDQQGLYFSDIDFTDENLKVNYEHSIKSNNLNKFKSFYKGTFIDGLFEGPGSLDINQTDDYLIEMPLIITENNEFYRF